MDSSIQMQFNNEDWCIIVTILDDALEYCIKAESFDFALCLSISGSHLENNPVFACALVFDGYLFLFSSIFAMRNNCPMRISYSIDITLLINLARGLLTAVIYI